MSNTSLTPMDWLFKNCRASDLSYLQFISIRSKYTDLKNKRRNIKPPADFAVRRAVFNGVNCLNQLFFDLGFNFLRQDQVEDDAA